MSDRSSIEWTSTVNADGSVTPGATWNPVRGCTKVSTGCKNCYAETFADRWRGIKGHPFEQGFDLRLVPGKLDQPLRWKRARRIFVNSMSDLFHEGVSFEYIAAVIGVMAACPQHTFQVLTKRPERALEFFQWLDGARPTWMTGATPCDWRVHFVADVAHGVTRFDGECGPLPEAWPLPNVHLGVSCEDQQRADERIPMLLGCPATVRWVSAEPLLGPINLNKLDATKAGWRSVNGFPQPTAISAFGRWQEKPMRARLQNGIDWLVVGGESGHGARPCDVAWIRSIVEQCKAADVPVFVKQLGARAVASSRWDMSDEQFRANDAAGWTEHDGPVTLRVRKKGGELADMPEDIRVREFPR